MQELGPAQAAPTVEELIAKCGPAITSVMSDELSDTADPDRVFILRKVHQNYLYYRDLETTAPLYYGSIQGTTNVASVGSFDQGGIGTYDYTQNIFRGYARKLEAVLGNRMPNAIAHPNNASDESGIGPCTAANHAAQYIREKCDFQQKSLYLVFGLFCFGTNFWHVDWVVDGEKYGFKPVETPGVETQALGNASYACPGCADSIEADPNNPQPPSGGCPSCGAAINDSHYQAPAMVDVPNTTVTQVPRGGIEITVHNASEVMVPLDATSIDDCQWLDCSREVHKGKLLRKYRRPDGTNPLREDKGSDSPAADDTSASQYAENIRSAMASPIGLVRPKRVNYWTERNVWWMPDMYELVDQKDIRQMLEQNFPTGVRITSVRGRIVDLQEEKLTDRWQECKPEPSTRIMADPLGDDWLQVQDLTNNMINQRNETVERNNDPGFADPTRLDFDAWQNRRDNPTELFPALRPPGGSLQDIIYRPPAVQFSEQIAPFSAEIEERAKNISGLLDAIWGGGEQDEPTARQAELKKNAALMQLGVIWTMIGKSLEQVYMKACKLLANYEDGVLQFSKKNQFQQYQTLAVTIGDLRSDNYHFEADEAIPMTWGQQRDLLMWMLDKPEELVNKWGFNAPRNIFEFKQLLGMPGEHVPLLDNLNKGMSVITKLLNESAVPGQVDPTSGQPGPKQPSIPPDWEDDNGFSAQLAKDYLQANPELKDGNAAGYENVQLWGQANEAKANAPAPPPPPKASLAVSLKGTDIGDSAVQDAVQKLGLVDKGTPAKAQAPPPKPMDVPVTPEQIATERQKSLMPPPGPQAPPTAIQ